MLFFARVPSGCDVARKATWQSHAGPHGVYAARYLYLLIYIVYNMYNLPFIGRNYSTRLIAALYITDSFYLFLPCGTMFHTFSINCRPRGSTLGVGSAEPWKFARRSRGRADHRSLIAHLPFKQSSRFHAIKDI